MKKFIYILLIVISISAIGLVFADEFIRNQFTWSDEYESGNTRFLGFETSRGGWYIQAVDTTTGHRVTYAYESGMTYYNEAWAHILVEGSGVTIVICPSSASGSTNAVFKRVSEAF